MNSLPIPSFTTRRPHACFAILSILLASLASVSAQTFTLGEIVVDVSDYGDDSLALVNGNPAISFHSSLGLRFVRATDAVGTAWGASGPVVNGSTNGKRNSLAIVNGNPAISYLDANAHVLKFVRATNASGTAWGTPVDPDPTTHETGEATSLAVVNGFPAISYWDRNVKAMMFVRATDASGTGWGTPSQVGPAGVRVNFTSLLIVAGSLPAIGYCDFDFPDNAPAGDTILKFVRANDVNGSTWGTPLPLDNLGVNELDRLSMKVVSGRPAIAYKNRFVRATDPKGTTWGQPQTVIGSGDSPSLAVINGNPAIACVSGSLPTYVRATDRLGTTWSAPLSVSSVLTARNPSLLALANGSPAMSYESPSPSHRLVWGGGTLIPEISIEEPIGTGTYLTSGVDSVTFAATARGAVGTPKTFMITNFGHATLTLTNPSVTGGNAGDWTVDNTGISLSLPAGQSTSFGVTFSPTAGGDRTTTLRVTSNDPDENPFDFILYGTGLVPDISIEQPAGTNLPPGAASIAFSAVAGAFSAPKYFTIKNAGAAPLVVSSVATTGGGAGNFLVSTSGMLTTIPGGQQTTFAVFFSVPFPGGNRTTTLRIASNDPDETPYDITLFGTGVSFAQDTDGDGLSDTAEVELAALGFDWLVGQPALVDALYDNADGADLYSSAQVKILRIDTPFIQRNAATGQITLTIGLDKSTNLAAPNNFQPFPFTLAGTSIDAQGKIQFKFIMPDDTAFLRVEVQ